MVVASDVEDIIENLYKMYLISPNMILCVVPSSPRVFREAYPLLQKAEMQFQKHLAPDTIARNVQINGIAGERMRQFHLTVIEFPEDMALTNEFYTGTNNDNEIKMEFMPITRTYKNKTIEMQHTSTLLSWKVSIVPNDDRIVAQKSSGTKEDELFNLFGCAS